MHADLASKTNGHAEDRKVPGTHSSRGDVWRGARNTQGQGNGRGYARKGNLIIGTQLLRGEQLMRHAMKHRKVAITVPSIYNSFQLMFSWGVRKKMYKELEF